MIFKRQRVLISGIEVIARTAGDLVDTMMSYTKRISYVELFEEVARCNPYNVFFVGEGRGWSLFGSPTQSMVYSSIYLLQIVVNCYCFCSRYHSAFCRI